MAKEKNDYEVTEHQLFISPFRLWLKLNRQNKISKKKRWMWIKILLFVLLSAPFRLLQRILISRKANRVDLKEKAPVFVIGHWRSGTTHLHYLLALDKSFSYLSAFQAFFFNVAFVSKKLMKPLLHKMMPSTRPQDNVKINSNSPTEEEHPLTNLTEKAGMQSFFFPQNQDYFLKYNVFKNVTDKEVNSWKKTYHKMLQKIALFEGTDKRLLLKNPHNTGRIKVLLEMYPNAKFVFIHRDPYAVYSSTRILYDKVIKSQFLQEVSDEEIVDAILLFYKETLERYLEFRELIPVNQLIEISFNELDETPLESMQNIYESLELGDFNKVKPQLEEYLTSVSGFKKNKKRTIPPSILKRINTEWKFAFETWGYPVKE